LVSTERRRVSDEEEGTTRKRKAKKNSNEVEEKMFLSVSVTDTGVGMNEDVRRRCFTLFGNLKFKKDVN